MNLFNRPQVVNEAPELLHYINSYHFLLALTYFHSREENKKIKNYVDAAAILDPGGDDKLTFFTRLRVICLNPISKDRYRSKSMGIGLPELCIKSV